MENRGNIRHDFEVINNLDQGIKEGEGQKGVHKCELRRYGQPKILTGKVLQRL